MQAASHQVVPVQRGTLPTGQVAMETLILVAERDGPEMLARIGMMRALNRNGPQ